MDGTDPTGAGLRDEREPNLRSRAWFWLVVDGNRLVLAGGLLVLAYAGFRALDAAGTVAFADADVMAPLVGGTIAGVLSLTTIVLAINQLIVNPELGHVGQTRERLSDVRSLKEDLESLGDRPATPVQPVDFLAAALGVVQHNLEGFEDAIPAGGDPRFRTDADALVDHLRNQTASMDDLLAGADMSAYSELLGPLHNETTWQLFVVRRFLSEHEPTLQEDARAEGEELLRSLELFHVAQNYFMTTYVQRELAHVSRLVTAVGLVAVFAAFLAGLVYAGPAGPTVPAAVLPSVVAALLTVAFSPLAVFAAYILRIATLVRQTAHVGPFTTV